MTEKKKGLTRRDFLRQAAIVTTAVGAAACGAAPATPESSTGQSGASATSTAPAVATGKKYDGVTLRMLSQGGNSYEPAFNTFAQEFEEMTGATIEIEWAPWESLMPKVQADIASGDPQFDLFTNDIEFQYTIYPNLLPINDLIEQFDYNMDGFFPYVYEYGEGIAGQTGVRYGLPITTGVSLLFYRTDLISEFPTTWDGYTEVLAKHTGGDMKGLSFAGVTAQLVKLFLGRYWSTGEPLMTPDWQPLINGEQGVWALEMLKEHKENYTPDGILAWDNPDASNAFLNGDTAVLEGFGAFILPNLDDPEESNVVGDWKITGYPEGGTGNVTQHNMVIFNTSQYPEAAFEFMAYCTDQERQKRGALEYNLDPTRTAIYEDPEVVEARPYMPDQAEVLRAGKPFTPGVPQWLELFIALGEGASLALSGEASPQEALDETASKWEQSIAQAPLDFEYQE